MISRHTAWLEGSEAVTSRGHLGKSVLKNVVNFARKHLSRGLFFNKIAGWKPTTSST